MPIKYALFENNITSDPDDYAAMIQVSGSAGCDDSVQGIVEHGSTVNRPDILAVAVALKLAYQRRGDQGSLGDLAPKDRLHGEIGSRALLGVSARAQARGPHRPSPKSSPDLTATRTQTGETGAPGGFMAEDEAAKSL